MKVGNRAAPRASSHEIIAAWKGGSDNLKAGLFFKTATNFAGSKRIHHARLLVGATFDCRTHIGKIEGGPLVTSSYIAIGILNIHHAFLLVGATFDCRTHIGKIEGGLLVTSSYIALGFLCVN